jgi:hypothetical protein
MMIMDKIVDFIRDKKPSKKIENVPLTGQVKKENKKNKKVKKL